MQVSPTAPHFIPIRPEYSARNPPLKSKTKFHTDTKFSFVSTFWTPITVDITYRCCETFTDEIFSTVSTHPSTTILERVSLEHSSHVMDINLFYLYCRSKEGSRLYSVLFYGDTSACSWSVTATVQQNQQDLSSLCPSPTLSRVSIHNACFMSRKIKPQLNRNCPARFLHTESNNTEYTKLANGSLKFSKDISLFTNVTIQHAPKRQLEDSSKIFFWPNRKHPTFRVKTSAEDRQGSIWAVPLSVELYILGLAQGV
jgi:hypothetical protein